MTLVRIHEAETQLARLIERAKAGEEVVIARGDTPVVKLTPVPHPTAKRVPALMKGIWPDLPDSFFFDPLPEDELRLWEGGDENSARWSRVLLVGCRSSEFIGERTKHNF